MNPSRLQRMILSLYPQDFRDRYGEELASVATACGGGPRVTADLLLSAVRARFSDDLVGAGPDHRRLRLQRTTATVFSIWAWSTVAIAAFARAVDDQPVPGLRSWGWSAYSVGAGIFTVAAVAIGVVGFGYWLTVVVPAVRSRNRAVLVPALVPIPVVALWLAGTGILSILARHIVPAGAPRSAQGPPNGWAWLALSVYAVFTLECVGVCISAVRRALDRARLPERSLELSSVAAAVATAALAAIAACASVCLARVLMVGGIGPRVTVLAVAPVVFLVAATVAAVRSSVRGVGAL